ncbi:hypothetical protein JHK87_016772 [Glycine soja]|nr:hypothetical protein JHK87_016772 [Glycine soja]
MVRVLRSCIQSILKLVNSVIGMAGLAMILYSAWMIRVWQRKMGELPFGHDSDYPPPWFIYMFLGLGVAFCVITCLGHVAAETANGCCLYLYMVFVVLLIMLEAAVTVDVFVNQDWEKDFPKDPSGSFDQFKNFIRSNYEMCKWVGLSLVSVQVRPFCFELNLDAWSHGRWAWQSFSMPVDLEGDLYAGDGLAIGLMAMRETSSYRDPCICYTNFIQL